MSLNQPKFDWYPEIEPYDSGFLRVSDLHQIFYEQVGNPNGKPVLFVHGGPGGGISPDHRRYFDPEHYRIILFDQRGCGRSQPFAEITENTTWELIGDIEKLREHFKVKQWHVFGGSWGSTLSLAYAINHSERVSALVLRGIFLCRRSELLWFYQEGANHLFPDRWEPYWNFIPADERSDMMAAYYKRLTSDNEDLRLQAAKRWSIWEGSTSHLLADPKAEEEFEDPRKALPFARIECHYFVNKAFFPSDNYLLENVHKVRKIPAQIVHGRYDVVCPLRSAWDLHKAWPEATLTIVPNSGHAASEPGTRSKLIEATDGFRGLKFHP